MNRAFRFAIALALMVPSALALPRAARAEAPSAKAQPVYVLTLSTDDSDDQADALTQAMRSRVRQSQGWSLLETPQSFETLSIALKCPPKPDAACLQRIADQLHADHFVWGTLSKGGSGQVKATLHMWTRGKSDVEATSAYSDNIKDANDESLRAIATSLFGTLAGTGANGTLVVHAGNGGGDVLVDGFPHGALEGGVARIDVPVGPHSISVRVPGFDSGPPRTANVTLGAEQDVTIGLMPSAPPPEGGSSHSSFPVRKVLEYGALVAGGVLLVVSGVETAAWINDSNQSNTDRQAVPKNVTDVCADQVNAQAQDACTKSRDATTVSSLGWVFGGLGAALVGTGIVLILTDHPSSVETSGASASMQPRKPAFDVVPALGPRSGGMTLRVTF